MAQKFFVRGTSEKFNALPNKEDYNNSIVFLTDTHQIYQNGIYYGLSAEQEAKLNSLTEGLQDLKYFTTITGNTGTAAAPGPQSTLNIKGINGITTEVGVNGVSVKHTNSVTAGTASGDSSKTLTFGGTFTIPSVTYDAQGHITGKGSTTMTMPANPNTHYEAKNVIGALDTAKANAAATNPYLNLVENNTVKSSHQIVGSGKVSVKSDETGKITIEGAKATVATGSTNGTILVDGQSVAVKGLGSAAYTEANAYATAEQGEKAENAVPNTRTVNGHALSDDIEISKTDVGLGNVTNESKATMFTNPEFTGTPKAPTAAAGTNTTQIATTAFVQNEINEKISAADALRFKGVVDGTHALPTTNVSVGDTYKVAAAGIYADQKCEVGDMIIATAETPAWTVIQTNIDGAVTTTNTLTDDAVILGNGNKTIKMASTVGTSNIGIYLNNGVPTATQYAVNKDVPANAVFTDTSVTDASHHYKPTSGSAISVPSPTESIDFGGTVITGINKDAAGHITSLITKKLPANPNTDTNTTYTFAGGNGSFAVTPSDGTVQTVSIGKPSEATKADQLKTARLISITGDGSAAAVSFNGTSNVSLDLVLQWEEL